MKEFCILTLMFFVFTFIGWICEIVFTLVERRYFINRGFLIGPCLPIYGFGGLGIHLLLTNYKNDPLVLYCIAVIMCGVLEYFTSYIMEKIFKNRWWDYSHYKFNINGRICLETMLPFGVGALILVYGVNPLLVSLLSSIPTSILFFFTSFLLFLFVIDIIISFNIIVTLKNVSNQVKYDSTELITKKVQEKLSDKTYLFTRLFKSFPDMKIYNKMAELKNKLKRDKTKLKEEKKKVKTKKKS